MDLCLIRHYIHFYVTYLHALMQVDHHLLSYLFVFFYFCSITPFCSTSSNSFLFSSYLMFDLGSTPTLYYCLLDMSFIYYHFFVWEPLGPWLMRFFFYALHLMHEGYGDYIIRIFEPNFLSFLSPYYLSLHYISCLKTILKPWLHTLYMTTHSWAILEIGWRLFLKTWWMESGWWITLGHTHLTDDGFSEVMYN